MLAIAMRRNPMSDANIVFVQNLYAAYGTGDIAALWRA
jgi:hypothetical protein